MKLGDTFFAGHLWIVCSNQTADGSVVIFNVTSLRSDSDRNCIVQPGDHPAVSHDSVIAYEYGRILTKAEQGRLEGSSLFAGMRREPATPELLTRIQKGALRSDQTPIEIQDIVREQAGQP